MELGVIEREGEGNERNICGEIRENLHVRWGDEKCVNKIKCCVLIG